MHRQGAKSDKSTRYYKETRESMNKERVSEHAYTYLVLIAIEHLGGKAKRDEVLNLMEQKKMPAILAKYPEEQEGRASDPSLITWRNKASFSRNTLKNWGWIQMPAHGIWEITDSGRDTLARIRKNPAKPFSVASLRKLPQDKRDNLYIKFFEMGVNF
jgi:hypothetical protein